MRLIKDAPKNSKTQYKKEWAKRAYKNLMAILGNRCNYCCVETNLQFDCIIPQGDRHHRMNTIGRIQFYRKQHFHFGNVQVLCEKCNARKGSKEDAVIQEMLCFQPQLISKNPF